MAAITEIIIRLLAYHPPLPRDTHAYDEELTVMDSESVHPIKDHRAISAMLLIIHLESLLGIAEKG